MTRKPSADVKGVTGHRAARCGALEGLGDRSPAEILERRRPSRAKSASCLASAVTLGAGTEPKAALSTQGRAEWVTWSREISPCVPPPWRRSAAATLPAWRGRSPRLGRACGVHWGMRRGNRAPPLGPVKIKIAFPRASSWCDARGESLLLHEVGADTCVWRVRPMVCMR